jgi:hypothetical protein
VENFPSANADPSWFALWFSLNFREPTFMPSSSGARINSLVESLPKAALLLLVNFRPEFHGTWSVKSYYTHVAGTTRGGSPSRGSSATG